MIERLSQCDLNALKGLKQGQKAPFLSVNYTNEKKNLRHCSISTAVMTINGMLLFPVVEEKIPVRLRTG